MSLAKKESFENDSSYYDLLELTPDATGADVREAYLRLKNAYSKDSVALYSLIDHEETGDLVGKIEDAYHVLSDPDRRKQYDATYGTISSADVALAEVHKFPKKEAPASKPKLAPRQTEADLDPLSAPSTDFNEDVKASHQSQETTEIFNAESSSADISIATPKRADMETPANTIETLVETLDEKNWHGELLKKVRESLEISMEEMSDYTKITKRYLRAIEEENFDELPAAVYLRGFVVQIAKKLRLPHDDVAKAYVQRYREAKPEI